MTPDPRRQPLGPLVRLQQRRSFLGNACRGVGGLALASLLNPRLLAAAATDPRGGASPATRLERWTGMLHPLHFAPKAKRVIFLCMAGGPSHLETFDYKPKLA